MIENRRVGEVIARAVVRRASEQCLLSMDKNILLHGVVPYLDLLTDVVAVASTCKELNRVVYSNSQLWELRGSSPHGCQAPIKICMVKGCNGCGRSAVDPAIALNLLSRAPIRYLSVHTPFKYFVHVVRAILKRRTVLDLCVKFAALARNSKLSLPSQLLINSPNAKCIGNVENYYYDDEYGDSASSKDGGVFLKNITFFGWPSTSPNMVQYCEEILAVIGGNSQSIQFYDSSPSGILWRLASVCPKLVDIVIEGEQSSLHDSGGEGTIVSSTLTTLRLSNTRVKLSGQGLQTPKLILLEYLDDVSRGKASSVFKKFIDVYEFVQAIPCKVKDFGIRIASKYADHVLLAITGHLHHLESLRLHLPDGDDDRAGADNDFQNWDDAGGTRNANGNNNDITFFSARQMTLLKTECPRLVSIEITNTFICLEPAALLVLGELENLRRIRLLYNEDLLQILPRFLAISRRVEEVEFFEDAAIGRDEWLCIDNKIAVVSDLFPSVLIHLMHEEME